MKERTKISWISALSAVFGAIMGSVSGSNSKFVIVIVSAVFALLFAWGIRGFFK